MSQKRSIFQEVGSDQALDHKTPRPGGIDKAPKGARKAVSLWLMLIFVLVMAMILVGGLTRLTDSGLSITEWKPVTGAVPPMDDATWGAEFEKYQNTPQFELTNSTMTLAEFKSIYWWEWGHRQLGRFVGLVWALGFFGFLLTKRMPIGWTIRLLGLGALGGLQGAIGWWMVSSGLTGRMVSVASYRLAIHLGLAFAILGLTTWYILQLRRRDADLMSARRNGEPRLAAITTGLMHFSFVQILIGALVAGIDAGRGYIDWPRMAGQWIPDDLFMFSPLWSNFFENPALVQFTHRSVGYLVFIFGIVVWRRSRKSGNLATKQAFDWVMVMLFGQMVLGIVTVLNAAPWTFAISHQLGAIILWVLIIRARFLALYPRVQNIRGTA